MSRIPDDWMRDIKYIPWIILPDELSPIWIGLMTKEVKASYGRLYSKIGGWFASGKSVNSSFRFQPHIFNKPKSAWATVHEIGHALAHTWNSPIDELFNPDKALYDYMASNPSEYFACGLDAFLYPEQDDNHWNIGRLAKADDGLLEYFRSKINESANIEGV